MCPVCGVEGGCWERTYSAGLLLTVWDLIQSQQNCLPIPRHMVWRGEEGKGMGPQKINSCWEVIFQLLLRLRDFALPSLSLIVLRNQQSSMKSHIAGQVITLRIPHSFSLLTITGFWELDCLSSTWAQSNPCRTPSTEYKLYINIW